MVSLVTRSWPELFVWLPVSLYRWSGFFIQYSVHFCTREIEHFNYEGFINFLALYRAILCAAAVVITVDQLFVLDGNFTVKNDTWFLDT